MRFWSKECSIVETVVKDLNKESRSEFQNCTYIHTPTLFKMYFQERILKCEIGNMHDS